MIDTFYSLLTSDPWLVLGFLVSLLVCAGGCAVRTRIKVTHRDSRHEIHRELDAVKREMDAEKSKRLARISDYRRRERL